MLTLGTLATRITVSAIAALVVIVALPPEHRMLGGIVFLGGLLVSASAAVLVLFLHVPRVARRMHSQDAATRLSLCIAWGSEGVAAGNETGQSLTPWSH